MNVEYEQTRSMKKEDQQKPVLNKQYGPGYFAVFFWGGGLM